MENLIQPNDPGSNGCWRGFSNSINGKAFRCYEFFINEFLPNAVFPPTFSLQKVLANLTLPDLTPKYSGKMLLGQARFINFGKNSLRTFSALVSFHLNKLQPCGPPKT